MNKTIKINGYRVRYTNKVSLKDVSAVEEFLNEYYFKSSAFRLLERHGYWYAINESDIYFNMKIWKAKMNFIFYDLIILVINKIILWIQNN